MKNFTVEGLVLKRKDFGEADRIVTIFTKRHGRMKLLAKGVRRIASRRGPNIELFNHATFSVHKGRSFDLLSEVYVHSTYPKIRRSLEMIGLAYYVCELVDGLCAEGQSHPKVYDLLIEIFDNLDRGLIHTFEMELLSELGFWPHNRIAPAHLDTTAFIEQILERKIKSKKILAKFS